MKLIKMSQEEFGLIKGKMIADYAKDKIKLGIWGEDDALELAKETFNTVLKKGVETENQYLYNVADEKGNNIAFIWLGKSNTEIFVYNINFYELDKNQKYEKELLDLIEEKAVNLQGNKISYHMFGYQKEAIEILESSGYSVTDVTLSKKL